MRRTLVTACLAAGVGFLAGVASDGERAIAQRPSGLHQPGDRNSAPGGPLVTHSIVLDDGRQQLSVIDSQQRCMAVYHVDPRTGSLSLKSVRNIHWDLQMEEFNSGGNPSPGDIRTLVERR